MLLESLVFFVSLPVLLASARFFTVAAERLGIYLRLSPFVIGVFIVGVGTSLPELVAGIASALAGRSEIVAGNVLGANIANIFLILGLAAFLSRRGVDLGERYIMVDLNFMVGAAFLLSMSMMDGEVLFSEGVFLLMAYGIYVHFLLGGAGRAPEGRKEAEGGISPLKELLILLLSGLGLYLGADYTVEGVAALAGLVGVPSSLIGLTVLSLGTTLPELAVTITAATRGRQEIAVGNVLGSCVFNALMIPGFVSALGPVAVPAHLLGFSLPVFAAATLLFYLLTHDKKISPSEGLLFIVCYFFFLAKAVLPYL